MTSLTVVVCTHNRLALLERCLSHLLSCSTPGSLDVRVLVVANACNDGTDDWLDGLKAQFGESKPSLDWIREPIPGKSRALNRSLGVVDSDWVAFVDDDQRVATDFLQQFRAAIDGLPNARFLCGRLLPDWSGTEANWVRDEGEYRIFPPPIPSYDLGSTPKLVTADTELPPGGDFFVHSSLLGELGEFSTDLGPRGHDLGGSEDRDYVIRAMSLGEPIHYRPDIVQYHYVDHERLRLAYLMRKAFQRSRSITRDCPDAGNGIPRYFWKKLAIYFARALFSVNPARTRFYLVRLAATAGEMRGLADGPSASTSTPRQYSGEEHR